MCNIIVAIKEGTKSYEKRKNVIILGKITSVLIGIDDCY